MYVGDRGRGRGVGGASAFHSLNKNSLLHSLKNPYQHKSEFRV